MKPPPVNLENLSPAEVTALRMLAKQGMVRTGDLMRETGLRKAEDMQKLLDNLSDRGTIHYNMPTSPDYLPWTMTTVKATALPWINQALLARTKQKPSPVGFGR